MRAFAAIALQRFPGGAFVSLAHLNNATGINELPTLKGMPFHG
jgi:hypothetical protein